MAMTEHEIAERLTAEAARRGLTAEQLLADLAEDRPPRRRLGFVALGSSASGRTAREADDMLAEGFGRS